ncbi:AraC family transcriptional regulator [Streptomyces sp. NPDC006798]|uniref:helix-turn-helix transcriptional regulator n=1 Tax=Streptomyces sp. NPDC006798 TaxID=3155462 RepID=UPI003403DA13
MGTTTLRTSAGSAPTASEPPVRTGARRRPPGGEDFIAVGGHAPHEHPFHQFLYVPLGRILVSALGRDHELSASVALWIPAGVVHSAHFGRDAVVVPESFDGGSFDLPYTEPTPVNVNDAQRALLLGRMRSSTAERDDPAVFAVLCAAHPDSLPLPQPVTPAALAVARGLARAPGDARTATDWAAALYVSSTSLRRAFRAETGMAFSEWRTRLRLNHALALLDQGQLVSSVAAQVGFVSTNGFILAFRRYFGRTPGSYARSRPGGPV